MVGEQGNDDKRWGSSILMTTTGACILPGFCAAAWVWKGKIGNGEVLATNEGLM